MATLTPPRERERTRGPGSGTGDASRVIVLNDDHNTFDGVAFALAAVLPGVDFERGMSFANRIHDPAIPSGFPFPRLHVMNPPLEIRRALGWDPQGAIICGDGFPITDGSREVAA